MLQCLWHLTHLTPTCKAKLQSLTLQMRADEARGGPATKYTDKSCHLLNALERQALYQLLCPHISHKHPTRWVSPFQMPG